MMPKKYPLVQKEAVRLEKINRLLKKPLKKTIF
jgi:hypothetical protein